MHAHEKEDNTTTLDIPPTRLDTSASLESETIYLPEASAVQWFTANASAAAVFGALSRNSK